MITEFSKPIAFLACCALLAGCGGAPSSNELRFDNDGNGRFSGSAGAGWTPQEIKTQAASTICGNAPVAQFNVSVLPSAPGIQIFSGTCASGAGGVTAAGAVQNNVVTAPSAPPVPAAANSSAWDGSTPYVD